MQVLSAFYHVHYNKSKTKTLTKRAFMRATREALKQIGKVHLYVNIYITPNQTITN